MAVHRSVLSLAVLASFVFPSSSLAVLEVTLDSGMETVTVTDDDADGDVEIDTTVSGMFEVSATVRETITPVRANLSIDAVDGDPVAVLRNVSANAQTFSVTVRSSTFPVQIASPLGWSIFYGPTADDAIDMSVDIPSHDIVSKINEETLTLGAYIGTPLTSTTEIYGSERGTESGSSAEQLSFTWTFTLGANDEFRINDATEAVGSFFSASVFNQKAACVHKMNSYAGKLGSNALKIDTRCAKTIGADVTACVDGPTDERTLKTMVKLTNYFADRCDPLPGWGVNGESCCVGGTGDGDACIDSTTCGGGSCAAGGCVATSAISAANAIVHDVFGPAVEISAAEDVASCQYGVLGAILRLNKGTWQELARCLKGSFTSISNDVELNTTCIVPMSAPDSEVMELREYVTNYADVRCGDKGVSGLGTVFPGECSGASDEAFADCVVARTNCRFCETVNVTAAIDPPLDCDVFDDGTANGTCP